MNGLITMAFVVIGMSAVSACKIRNSSELKLSNTKDFSKADFDVLKGFMSNYCSECHTTGGEGSFSTAEDIPSLSASPIVVKGKPNESRLWLRLADRSMPATQASAFPNEDEKLIVKRWIEAGAPLKFGDQNESARKFLSAGTMLDAVAADLANLRAGDRRFMRYLVIRNQYNQSIDGVPLIKDRQLTAFRNGLSFLVNSLHWRREVTPLTTVERTEGTVLRLDLRRYSSTAGELRAMGIQGLATTSAAWNYEEGYGLTPSAWESLIANDPYKIIYQGKVAQGIRNATGTNFPLMRGDIFTFLAARSHNADKAKTFKFAYYRILGIDGNFENVNRALFGRSLDDRLRDKGTNILRAGFADSAVSGHNRLLERHTIPTYETIDGREAAYWLSYDFAGSNGNQHLESHPLGPQSAFGKIAGGKHVFAHDGGEVIFSLPNGLQAFMLFTAAGKLLDEGPTDIVSDKKRIVVINGVSCMDCHKMGMIPKADSVRSHIEQNRGEYTDEELSILRRLFQADPVVMNSQFGYDTSTYLRAKAKTKVDVNDPELREDQKYNEAIALGVPDLHDLFVSDVTPAVAASEVELTEAEFKTRLNATPELRKILAAFLTEGKIVKRETFREFFPQIVKGLGLNQIDEGSDQSALCEGCTATCVAQVFTPQGSVLGISTFDGTSTKSEGAARASALNQCNGRLTEGLRSGGYGCKIVGECKIN